MCQFLSLFYNQPTWTSFHQSVNFLGDEPSWALSFYRNQPKGLESENPTNLEILQLAVDQWKPKIENDVHELAKPYSQVGSS